VVKKTTFEAVLPSPEAIDAMGQALCSHWAAAAHAMRQSPFWPRPASWLNRHAAHLAGGGVWFARKLTI
jgi:hypothetical protein